MTHTDARQSAELLSELAIEIEAGLDPEIVPFEVHLAGLATDCLEAVGHAHTIAAHLAARIQATPDAGPDLINLGRRLASVASAPVQQPGGDEHTKPIRF